jgi:hypothetical protein
MAKRADFSGRRGVRRARLAVRMAARMAVRTAARMAVRTAALVARARPPS